MNTKDSSNQIDMEQLLQDGNILKLKPQGYSMYPLFIPGRDEALIQQAAWNPFVKMMWFCIAGIIVFLSCTASAALRLRGSTW